MASTEHRDVWETTKVSKPTIVAINGACAGIGLVQALMCDLRFAAEGVKFTTAFARRGLVAEYGISWALPRLVGTANALDLLMSGRVFLAEEAKAIGMVNDVVPAEQLMDHVLHYAADVAANSCPTSMAVMKRQVYADSNRSLEESSNGAIPLMQASLKRPDFVEGVQSYLAEAPAELRPGARRTPERLAHGVHRDSAGPAGATAAPYPEAPCPTASPLPTSPRWPGWRGST